MPIPVYITKPLTKEEMEQMCDENCFISVVIKVDLDELFRVSDLRGLEGRLDLLSELAVGSNLLMDVNYKTVPTTSLKEAESLAEDEVYMEVSGDVFSILDG